MLKDNDFDILNGSNVNWESDAHYRSMLAFSMAVAEFLDNIGDMKFINTLPMAMEMGHKYVTTTQLYLRFQLDEIKDHFPSLVPIIESMENVQKNSTRANILRANIYNNLSNLSHSHRE